MKETIKTRVLYDSQAFDMQTHGGVSRCFTELYTHLPDYVKAKLPIIETDNAYLNNIGFPENGFTFNNCLWEGKGGIKKFLYKLRYNLAYRQYSNWDRNPKLNLFESIRLLKKGKFDVFHPTFFDPYFLKYLGDKPFVLTIHDMITELYPNYYPADTAQLQFKKKLIPLANHIVVVSENTKKDVIRLFNIPEEKISVVYHGIDDTPYIPKENSNSYGEYLLYVGERHWYKNFYHFVYHTIPILKKYRDLKVVCTGKPFSYEELTLLDFADLKDRFVQTYVKSDQDFLDLYHNAIAFVYPSEYEGFGIPILEAYKADCPVMLNKASCFPEIAEDAAIYFDVSKKSSSFEEQFETLYHLNATEREALLQKQRQQLAKYSWKKSAQQLAEVYRKLV